VEGRQAVRELLLAGRRRVHEVLVATESDTGGGGEAGGGGRARRDSSGLADLVALANSVRVPVQHVSRKRLDAEARSEAHQGVLARAAAVEEADLDELLAPDDGGPPFLVLVDGVTDPGNLGAILRSADGAGVTGVVLPRHRAVHLTPTAAKAAAGAIEHVPMALVGGLPAAMERTARAGVRLVGLDGGAPGSLFDLGDRAGEPIALVLGAEGAGLSRLVRQRCDLLVGIPMRGRLASLNVSAAAALACYEVARHRQG
jgi:23S rRNA (guanosine2251-2'-O)-methyltransferase